MIADRHEIAVERGGERRIRPAEHAEDVGGVAKRRIGRDRGLAGAGAQQHRCQHRRRRDQAQGIGHAIAVGHHRDACAHTVVERQLDEAGEETGETFENLATRLAERPAEPGAGREVVDEAVEQQCDRGLVAHPTGDLVERMAANDQSPADAVDIGQDGLGRHHIV
jgi:hypothetical protein